MFRTVTKPELWFDIGVAVVYAAIFALAGDQLRSAATVLLGLAFAVPLAIRRVSPVLALALSWCAALLQMLSLESPHLANFSILIVLYSTARYGTRWVRYLGLISAIVGAVVASIYTLSLGALIDSILLSLPEFVAAVVLSLFGAVAAFAVLGLSWAVGLLVRTRALAAESRAAEAVALEEQQRSEQALALLEERHRIARDMHDIVAHSLAVVIAQADGARYGATAKPALATEALATISTTARAALADVRVLLGQLRYREGEAPQPDLRDVARLLEQMRASGLEIELDDTVDPDLVSTAIQLVAYRILQEGLTNSLRHGATSAPTTVTMGTADGVLSIRIENPVATAADGAVQSPGHGLSGMKERAVLAGGRVTIARPPGRFRVTATVPLTSAEGMS